MRHRSRARVESVLGRILVVLGALVLSFISTSALAQQATQRGFAEARATLYPQDAPLDSTNAVVNLLFRDEASWRPAGWLTFAGAFDARTDTHGLVEREWRVDWSDRGIRRPAFSIRRLGAAVRRAGITLEVGKQFVRWGKADVLNPTDRFAPRDFMEVVDNEFLGVTAARVTFEHESDTVDAVFARFTPSRVPLPTDRWAGLPASVAGAPAGGPQFALLDGGATYPSRPQAGARWNHLAEGFEFSVSAYDGFNHLPSFSLAEVSPEVGSRAAEAGGRAAGVGQGSALVLMRFYPRMRMFGGDAAVPLSWVTLKGEAAYYASPDGESDEYGLYVLQAERQAGEWFVVAGYAGEFVTKALPAAAGGIPPRSFALDHGLARSFLGRASYTIDVNRNVAFEGAVRQNAKGLWLKAEYSQAAGQHARATVRGNLIRGDEEDFLGRYRLNSNVEAILRYSF